MSTSDESSKFRDNENTRPCPTCRMPVSVLAVKCRFCGAEVGRPKEATRSLSIDDLGGETVVRYAPSSNVMDALEAFRNDETGADKPQEEQAQKGTLFGRRSKKQDEGQAAKRESDLPELDEKSRALASIAMPRSQKSVNKPVQRYTAGDYVKYAGIAAGVLVVLYVAVFMVPGWIAAMNAPPPNLYQSKYPLLKERNAPPVELLSAAVEAMAMKPTDEYQQHLVEARAMVEDEVNALLNARDWNRNNLATASDIAQKAADIDSGTEMQQLKTEVDAEHRLYNTILDSINPADSEATFRLLSSDEKVTVQRGDTVAGRFEVVSVTTGQVRLRDTERGNRSLIAKIGQRPEPA